MMDVMEMNLEEYAADLIEEKALDLIAKANDSARERELDKIREEMGRLQNVAHQACKRSRNSKG